MNKRVTTNRERLVQDKIGMYRTMFDAAVFGAGNDILELINKVRVRGICLVSSIFSTWTTS